MRRRGLGSWTVAGAIVGVLGIVALAAGGPPPIVWGSLLVSSTAVLVYCTLMWSWPARTFRVNPKLQEEADVLISENGLAVRWAGVSSHTDWAGYREVVSDGLVHLLYRDRDVYSVLPSAAFSTQGEDERFRQMVARKVQAP